jgi:hypothetical protein
MRPAIQRVSSGDSISDAIKEMEGEGPGDSLVLRHFDQANMNCLILSRTKKTLHYSQAGGLDLNLATLYISPT